MVCLVVNDSGPQQFAVNKYCVCCCTGASAVACTEHEELWHGVFWNLCKDTHYVNEMLVHGSSAEGTGKSVEPFAAFEDTSAEDASLQCFAGFDIGRAATKTARTLPLQCEDDTTTLVSDTDQSTASLFVARPLLELIIRSSLSSQSEDSLMQVWVGCNTPFLSFVFSTHGGSACLMA